MDPRFSHDAGGKPVGLNWELDRYGGIGNPDRPVDPGIGDPISKPRPMGAGRQRKVSA